MLSVEPIHIEATSFSRIINALDNNKDVKRVEATKRCLFGKADLEETKKLLKEQSENDRRRFRERFGIDVENIENLCENVRCDGKSKKDKVKRATKRKVDERMVFRPNNKQLKLTGGYQIAATI